MVRLTKFYYQQLSELKIAEARLKTLKDKKRLYRDRVESTTSTIKEDVSFGNTPSDKIGRYMIQIEETDQKIKEVEEEITVLKDGLKRMEEIQKNISGLEETIFRLYFIEQKTPIQITFIASCDRSTVYRYIKKIREKLTSCDNKRQKVS